MAPFRQMTVPAHLKHAGGRPSEYRPEYCQVVIDHMALGFSLTARRAVREPAVNEAKAWGAT